MPFTEGELAVKQIDAKTWELLEPLEYRGRKDPFAVPAGFRTDFASVPDVFVWLIPRYGAYTKAAILHDHLCRTALVNRSDADGLFRRALRELGVSVLRRWIMWAGVRAASHVSDAGWGQRALWLLVTLPAGAFLLVPAVVLTVWLALFWVLEWIAFAATRQSAPTAANPPRFTGAPSPES